MGEDPLRVRGVKSWTPGGEARVRACKGHRHPHSFIGPYFASTRFRRDPGCSSRNTVHRTANPTPPGHAGSGRREAEGTPKVKVCSGASSRKSIPAVVGGEWDASGSAD